MSKILIIPSGILSPDNLIESSFELTQAKILAYYCETSIFTVNIRPSVIANVKKLIKKILFYEDTKEINLSKILFQTINTLFFYLFKNPGFNIYEIDNVKIIECNVYSFFTKDNFDTQIRYYIKSGLKMFKRYFVDTGNKPDMIMAHGRFIKGGILAMNIKKKFNIKYTYTEYCTFYREGIAPESLKQVLSDIIENSSNVICISEGMRNDVEKFIGKEIDNAVIIPLPMDSIFESDVIVGKHGQESKFVFVNVGYLNERKRQERLIRAFGKAFEGRGNFVLNIIGNGRLYDKLNILIKELKLNDVVNLLGYKNPGEIIKYLDNSDVFVFPSKDETLGLAVIEALSRGLPVIATICGGPEYILNNSLGLLVSIDNEDELIKALKNMNENIKNYSRNDIRKYAIDNYGSKIVGENLTRIINNIITSKDNNY